MPTEDNFRLVEVEEPKEPISHILLKTLWLSLNLSRQIQIR
jgi:NADPH-dependent curcumin reductase CurA